MRRSIRRSIAIAVVGVSLLLMIAIAAAPRLIEQRFNQVGTSSPAPPSPAAVALHTRLQIADMHADSLLWKRDIRQRSSRGHVDLPRLEQGNVALQIFSSVTKTPRNQNYRANSDKSDNLTLLAMAQLQPPRTWTSLLQRSLWHADKLARAEQASNGRLRVVRTRHDLAHLLQDRASGKRVVGAMLSIEGMQDLEGRRANLERLFQAGFRMGGLVHFFDNELAGSRHGLGKGGLTRLGRTIVGDMERAGMIVDLAHASDATIDDVLAIATRPVVSSHGGVQGTCRSPRNLTDDQVRRIAAGGGLIGIGYWDAAICSSDPRAIAAAIAHVRNVAGIDHVALGSDFDGAVTTPFDSAQLVQVTNALLAHGFSEDEIAKVMGGNLLNFLQRNLPQ